MGALIRIIPEVCRMRTWCRACNGSLKDRRQDQVCWDHVKDIQHRNHPAVFKSPQVWQATVGNCFICGVRLTGILWTAIHSECVEIVARKELL